MLLEQALAQWFPVKNSTEVTHIVLQTLMYKNKTIFVTSFLYYDVMWCLPFTYSFSIWLHLSLTLLLKISIELWFYGRKMHNTTFSSFKVNWHWWFPFLKSFFFSVHKYNMHLLILSVYFYFIKKNITNMS